MSGKDRGHGVLSLRPRALDTQILLLVTSAPCPLQEAIKSSDGSGVHRIHDCRDERDGGHRGYHEMHDRPGWDRQRDGPPARGYDDPYHRGYEREREREREYDEYPPRGGRGYGPPGDAYGPPRGGGGYDHPPPPPPRRAMYDDRGYERGRPDMYERDRYERPAYRPPTHYELYDEGILPPPPPPRAPPPRDAGEADEADPEREAFEAELRKELEKVRGGQG